MSPRRTRLLMCGLMSQTLQNVPHSFLCHANNHFHFLLNVKLFTYMAVVTIGGAGGRGGLGRNCRADEIIWTDKRSCKEKSKGRSVSYICVIGQA